MNPSDKLRFDKLYQILLTNLKLQGLRPKTIESYSRAVRKTAEYFDCCPDSLTKEQLKSYFSHLVDTRSWSLVKIVRNALQFFYKHVLDKEWVWVNIVKPPKVQTLPNILTQAEVPLVLNAINKPAYRVYLLTVYSMGLRLTEALTLRPGDINAQHQQVHIRCSKGGKSRMVPLPELTLYFLRKHWATHRNPTLIFPRQSGANINSQTTTITLDCGGVQKAIKRAVEDCGIPRLITIRSLRHSYATHLLEKGVDLREIQSIMGHESPKTTERDTHLTNVTQKNARQQIASLINGLNIHWEKLS